MKKLYLEFVRGAAAITVLVYHCIERHPTNGPRHFYFSNWGTDAVMIFFILSGMVINMSQTNNPKSRKEFLTNRFIRLYPQLFAGLILGLIALYATASVMPSFPVIIGNFLMISSLKGYMNYIVPCFDSNGPIWSLSYEMFFYLIFTFTISRFQKKAIFAWLLISLAALPFYFSSISVGAWGHIFAMTTFSSIWLIGYYIYEYRNYFYADKYTALFSIGVLPLISRMHISTIYYDPVKYMIYALFAIPFFRYCLQLPQTGKKVKLYYLLAPYLLIVYTVFNQPYITFLNFVLYSSLPIGLMALCFMAGVLNMKEQIINFINKTGAVSGKYSYSIYISHFPVFFFCAVIFHSTLPYLLVSLPVIFIISYSLETYLQPAVVNYYRKYKESHLIQHNKSGQGLLHFRIVEKVAG